MPAKPFYLSKLFWINLVSFGAALLEAQEVLNVVPDAYEPYAAAAVFAANLALRIFSATALTSTADAARLKNLE